VGEIISYHVIGSSTLPFLASLVPLGCVSFGLSLTFPFCLHVIVLTIDFVLDFCLCHYIHAFNFKLG
jgi:hypothetical protein